MYATIEPTDTVVHRFTTKGAHVSTEHAILYDGDQEYFYYIWRNLEDHITDGRTFENWQIGWKGTYKDVKKQYVSIVHDMIIEGSGFYGDYVTGELKPLPNDEDDAINLIDKIRGTEI